MKSLFALLTVTLLSSSAFAFETGKFVCTSERTGPNGEKAVATVLVTKASLKTDAGTVTLPYMEYSYDDNQGHKFYAKGLAQVSGDSMSNTFNDHSVSLDSNSFVIVFKDGKAISRLGSCQKVR